MRSSPTTAPAGAIGCAGPIARRVGGAESGMRAAGAQQADPPLTLLLHARCGNSDHAQHLTKPLTVV
jgi:hypothetical protein